MRNADHKKNKINGRLEAVLFDLDGTLVSSELDFEAIRKEAGINSGLPILEHMERIDKSEAHKVARILDKHEERAARTCSLTRGVEEVFALLKESGVKSCILTRNSRRSAETAIRRHALKVDAIVAREDAPPKPSPEPVYLACRILNTSPEKSMVVGDYIFDIESGNQAGALTAWLRLPGRVMKNVNADYEIDCLTELVPIIKSLINKNSPGRN